MESLIYISAGLIAIVVFTVIILAIIKTKKKTIGFEENAKTTIGTIVHGGMYEDGAKTYEYVVEFVDDAGIKRRGRSQTYQINDTNNEFEFGSTVKIKYKIEKKLGVEWVTVRIQEKVSED